MGIYKLIRYCLGKRGNCWLRLVLLMGMFLHAVVLYAQGNVKGIVTDVGGLLIPDASVMLWQGDSVVAQSVNKERGFLLANIPYGSYVLSVSHVGCQVKKITLDIKGNMDLDTIRLSLGHELEEVVVKAARDVISYKNNLLHVNVKHTYLSELPNVENLLAYIPGVLLLGSKVTYFGKGQMLLLVNGREVKSMEEVSSLRPSQIEEIVVDNMPGAKYDSQYSAVLNIKTATEKPALMVYGTNTWGRHYSGEVGFTSQAKAKNALIDFAYDYRKRKNMLYSEQTEESFLTDNAFNRSFQDTTFSDRQSHDWQIGTQTKLGPGTLNLRYTGYYSSNRPDYLSFMRYASLGEQEDVDIHRTGKYAEQQHLATIDYLVEFNTKDIFRVTGDYLYQYDKDRSNAAERSAKAEKRTDLDFQGRYNIYSLLTEYEHRFSESAKLLAGIRYSHVNNQNDSRENDLPTFYKLRENRYAVYTEGNFQWRKVAMRLGLRVERFQKRYHSTTQDLNRYKDLFFLPSFFVSWQPSGDWQLSLSGNNKVSLPSFNELTPITTYLNQFSYMIGNPLLKPTIRYDFAIGAVWRNKLNVSVEYNLMRNDRVALSLPDEGNAQVLKYTYTNIDRSRQFTGMLAYSDHLWKRHAFSLSAGILLPNVKIPYKGQYLRRDTPSYFAQLFCDWKLGKMVNFSVSYLYQSKSYDKADVYTAIHDLGCNLTVIPIKNKLTINLQVNDILDKATGDWETNYGYIRTHQSNNADSRNITLSLRYTFNSFKPVRQGCSNSEEIERL